MVQKTKAAKMLYKFYGNPDGNKLSCYWNKLKKKPAFVQAHFLYHTPGIVKRDKGFPAFNTCFFKHSVQPDMPAQNGNNKNNKADAHK